MQVHIPVKTYLLTEKNERKRYWLSINFKTKIIHNLFTADRKSVV